MIEFPALWLKYGFFALGGLLLLLAFVYLLNGLRYGARMTLTVMTSGLFIAGVGIIAWLTNSMLTAVDWSSTFSVPLPDVSFLRFGF
ncbi:MAG: hypothetical protein AAB402_04750 [Patescibacteria group bacterium]